MITAYEALTEALQSYVLTVPSTQCMAQGSEALRLLTEHRVTVEKLFCAEDEEPVTKAQLVYLRRLGHRQHVKTKRDASNIIYGLTKGKE